MALRLGAILVAVLSSLAAAGCGCGRGNGGEGGAVPGRDQPTEKARLQGTWRAVEVDGDSSSKPASREEVAAMRLTYTFEGDTLRVAYDEFKGTSLLKGEYEYRVDPTHTPCWIDHRLKGGDEKWTPGVYELDGDRLKVRWAVSRRPASVDDRVGVSAFALLERVK